jgi:hypothetical protein
MPGFESPWLHSGSAVAHRQYAVDRLVRRSSARENGSVGIYVELRDHTGRAVTGLTDPDGGNFDAAGDFDRFIDRPPYGEVSGDMPVITSIEPYGETRLPSGVMGQLIADCTRVLDGAEDGPERRDLIRLRALAEECSRHPDSALFWIGD